MSKLRVQEIAHTNGTVGASIHSSGAVGMPGSIAQVSNVYITEPSSQSIPSDNSYNNITNMSLSITSKLPNSKFYIISRWFGEFNAQSAAYNTMWSFKRNGTVLGQPPQPGSVTIGIHMAAISYWANDADSTPETIVFDYVDAPELPIGSTITYDVCVSANQASKLYNNRCTNATTSGGYERGTSSIVIMEIAQ